MKTVGINFLQSGSILKYLILSFFIACYCFLSPGPLVVLCLAVVLALFVISQICKEDFKFVFSVFLLAFLIRAVLSFVFYEISFLEFGYREGFLLPNDSWGYSVNGERIMALWEAGVSFNRDTFKSQSGTVSGYDFFNAIIYSLLGVNPLSMFFINSFFGALSVVFIYAITKTMHNRHSARSASIIMLAWPSLVLWSTQNFKEPIVLLSVTILIWSIFKLTKQFRFYLLFSILISTLVLREIREFAVFVFYFIVLPMSVFAALISKKENKVLIAIFVFIGVILFTIFAKHLPYKFASISNFLEWAQRMRDFRAYGGSVFLGEWDFTDISRFIVFLPVALLMTWLAPFPWQIGSMQQVIAIPEMIIFYLLAPLVVFGAFYIIKNKNGQGILMLVYISFMSIALALIEGNIGTLFRHRAMILPFCFILAAITLTDKKLKSGKI